MVLEVGLEGKGAEDVGPDGVMRILFLLRHVAFKVSRGQVVEQHVELRAEEIAPALAQVG